MSDTIQIRYGGHDELYNISASGETDYPLAVLQKKSPLTIRQETPNDHAAVYELTKAAFAGADCADGTEQELLGRMRKCDAFIPELSLVAESDGQLAAHIMFTKMKVADRPALLLAIVSVLPEYQKQGVGGALIFKGHKIAAELGYGLCLLVGHKDYYPRFGYETAGAHGIEIPFDAPDECKMVRFLDEDSRTVKGMAVFPPEFY